MALRTSTLPTFSPPAYLDDFTPATQKIWSDQYISMWMTGEINADSKVVPKGRTKLSQFFNGTLTAFDTTQDPKPATWNAFPKLVSSAFNSIPLRWQVADASRMFQDEYLEWSVSRDGDGNIINAEFTCEGPEYWQVFASYQRDDFLKKVREINPDRASEMGDDDFFIVDPKTKAQVYNPYNYWNIWSTSGSIAHLIQPNNTLGAEIDIAAQSTVIRAKNGKVVTDQNQLILCSKYGNPGRNSDPTIGGTINPVSRGGKSISVADPVALYINNVNWSNFMYDLVDTDGEADSANLIPIPNPEEVFKCIRGDLYNKPNGEGQGLRLHVKVPDGVLGKNGQQLNVSNIYDNSKSYHLRYGAQIADYVTMSVSVVTTGATAATPLDCFNPTEADTQVRVNPMKNTHQFL